MLWNKQTKQNLAILLMTATVLGVTVAAWAKKPDRPDPTPSDPVITYSLGELRVMDADGGNNERIFRGYASSPRWSPDGQEFAYFGEVRKVGRGIYTNNLDGSNRQLLVKTGGAALPYWSFGDVIIDEQNHGEKIVFSYPTDAQFIDPWVESRSEANNDIFIMNTDGSGLRHLIETPDIIGTPDLHERDIAWSPDGQWLAVIVYTGVYPVDQLYMYELGLDSDEEITVVSITNIHKEAAKAGVILPTDLIGPIDWSNNGEMLALTARINGAYTPSELILVDTVTYEKTQVIEESKVVPGFSGVIVVIGPSFSPDDSKLVFGVRSDGRDVRGIYSINIDGTGLTKLAKTSSSPGNPDWWVGSN